MSRHMNPAMVAEYQVKLPDKKLLQQKLNEFFEQNREKISKQNKASLQYLHDSIHF